MKIGQHPALVSQHRDKFVPHYAWVLNQLDLVETLLNLAELSVCDFFLKANDSQCIFLPLLHDVVNLGVRAHDESAVLEIVILNAAFLGDENFAKRGHH
jgi:hypothetical protein